MDDIAIVKSMETDAFNHAPAQIFALTGHQQFGRPSIGAWVTYGLGSESKDLPGFVVFSSGSKGPSGGNSCWGSGFLPSVHAGTLFRSAGDPVLFLSNPAGHRRRDAEGLARRHQRKLNEKRLGVVGDPEIAARISAYEMAGRMQASAPELMDLSKESQEDARDVRRRARQAELREQLPARAAADRARRAVRATLPRGVGPPRRADRAA